jgi:uncharacterized small protein (DUF1192 family)
MTNILKRIAHLAVNENITITELERIIGASKGVLSRALKNNTDIQAKWIAEIVDNYPLYNAEWLLTGAGEMLKTDTPVSAPFQATDTTIMDKLIKEVKDLSAENAVLKREIEELKEEIKNKSNSTTYPMVAEPEP